MNQFTDDLLDELETLQRTTEAVSTEKKEATRKAKAVHTGQNVQSASISLQAASVSKEAASVSQEAANVNQKAADAAIKMSHEFKAQVVDLSDSNSAWKAVSRQATKDLNKTKNTVTILMIVTIILGIILTVVSIGILTYTNSKQSQLKGEVLDVIQVESRLFNKANNMKVDQLASLMEVLSADVQHLSQIAPVQQMQPAPYNPPLYTDAQVTINTEDDNHKTTMQHEPADDNTHETNIHHAPTHYAPLRNEAHANAIHQEQNTQFTPPTAPQNVQTMPIANHAPEPATPPAEHNKHEQTILKLTQLVKSLIERQQRLEDKNAHSAPKKAIQTPANTSHIAEQDKQLASLKWLIKQQSKSIKEIKASLNNKPANQPLSGDIKQLTKSLKTLDIKVQRLSSQQKYVQSKVRDIDKTTKRLSEKPKPYSYQR